MRIWRVDELCDDLVHHRVTEKQQLHYILLIGGIFALGFSPVLWEKTIVRSWDYLNFMMNVVLFLAGSVWCFSRHQKGDGKDFLTRYLSLSVVANARFSVYLMPLFAGVLVYEQTLGSGGVFALDPNGKSYATTPLLIAVGFLYFVCVYWYIGHYLEKVGKLALETKSVEEVFGSPEETEPGESNESSVDDEGFEGNTEEDSAVMSPESIRDASGGLGDLPVVVEPVIRELNESASIEKARGHAVSSMLAMGMAGVSVVCQIATVGFFLHRAVVTSLVEMFLSFAVLAAFLATLMALASFFERGKNRFLGGMGIAFMVVSFIAMAAFLGERIFPSRPFQATSPKPAIDIPPKIASQQVLFGLSGGKPNQVDTSAFCVRPTKTGKPILLSSLRAFGALNGLPKQLAPSEIPKRVKFVRLMLGKPLQTRRVRVKGLFLPGTSFNLFFPPKVGDVTAFQLVGHSCLSPLPLATTTPKPGEHVWLLSSRTDQRKRFLHHGVVSSFQDNEIRYDFAYKSAGIAMSGTPLLNAKGEVLGVHLIHREMGATFDSGLAHSILPIKKLLLRSLGLRTQTGHPVKRAGAK